MKRLLSVMLLAFVTGAMAEEIECNVIIKDYTVSFPKAIYDKSVTLDLSKRQDQKVIKTTVQGKESVVELNTRSHNSQVLVVNIFSSTDAQENSDMEGLVGAMTCELIGDSSNTLSAKIPGTKKTMVQVICD